MSTKLQTGLDIISSLSTQKELAMLIAAASERIIELAADEGALVITDELKERIAAIEARHASGEGKTYTKDEFRKYLDNLASQ
jgi:hypothetical protein